MDVVQHILRDVSSMAAVLQEIGKSPVNKTLFQIALINIYFPSILYLKVFLALSIENVP